MKPGPKPLLGTTMTHAERQARYRASHADGAPARQISLSAGGTVSAGHCTFDLWRVSVVLAKDLCKAVVFIFYPPIVHTRVSAHLRDTPQELTSQPEAKGRKKIMLGAPRLWRYLQRQITSFILASAFPLAAPSAQPRVSAQDQLIHEYLDVFTPHGMVAVLDPIGQEPGDVIDKLGEEFVHRRTECFSDLAPRESPSSLPSFDLGTEAAIRLGLSVPQIGDAELQALRESHVILRFDHVTVQSVSQGELRQAVNRGACPEIGRLIDKDPEALSASSILLGEVFFASRIVRLNRASGGGSGLSLSGLRALASHLGLRLRAEAGGDLETAKVVELSTTQPLPVAFRPAFIRLNPNQPGYRSSEGRIGAPSVVPFNPASESDRMALGAWIDQNLPKVKGGAR